MQTIDLRGVSCPATTIRAKLALDPKQNREWHCPLELTKIEE